MSLPLPDVGKEFLTTVHYRQWEPKETHCSRGREVVELTDHNTPTTVHHWVASPRTGSSREPAVSPSIQHQAFHR